MGYGKALGHEALKGSEFAPQNTLPYLGKAILKGVGEGEIGKETKFNVIQFVFELLDGEAKGLQHITTVWEPQADADDERIDKMRSRVAYILQYFVGDELSLAAVNAATSFKNLQVNVKEALDRKKEVWEKKVVTVKILGWVYNGKSYLDFPNYPGFIADSESAAPLAWSRRELADCAEYKAELEAVPTDAAEVGEGSVLSEANTF